MLFGLTNVLAIFQRLIQNILREYLDQFAIVYLDDILIYSTSTNKPTEHVKKVLRKLEAASLLVKPEKCEFSKDSIEYLGYIITTSGIAMSQEKVKAILEWLQPDSVRAI